MARAYKPVESLIGMQSLYDVSTTQLHQLGLRVRGFDVDYGVGEFIYLKGVASCIEGSVVTFNQDDNTTTLLVANAIGPCAVALAAVDAATKFGWFQIFGKAVVDAATVVDNANVYATATAGEVDDAVVAGDRVKGAKFASANGTPAAGLAECEISYPFMDDAVAA